MSTKLKIDVSTGLLEVEGSEELVRLIYADFKERLISTSNETEKPPTTPEPQQVKPKTTKPKKSAANGAATSKSKPKKVPEFLKDLDLSGPNNQPSLKEFFARYEHTTNYERNLIFVYYLKEVLGIESVTLDHVFTCYRNVGQKIPKALEQSLRDTSKDRGWIDIDDRDDIKVPVAGFNHITHDMEKLN